MKNKILKIFIAIIFTFGIIVISNSVKANTIYSIDMDIFLNKNGDADVTETWNVKANKGTEMYHPYYNLGKSEITNLRVSKGSREFNTLTSWNTDKSFSQKAYNCGLHKIKNGVELCWGISDYGKDTYTVKYTITNFVAELTDSQMIYWQLIPYDFSNEIGKAKIKIYTDKYIEDTTDVWGYGNYGGLCYVSEGSIYMESDGSLDEDEYMTILVKFKPEMFNTDNKLDHDFDYYYEMSIKDAKRYEDNDWIIGLVFMGFLVGVFTLCFIVGCVEYKKGNSLIRFGEPGGEIPKDTPYYRDIPFNGDVIKAYFVAEQYRIIKNKTDILGALILKWLKEDKIQVENRGKTGIFKKEDTVLILNKEEKISFQNKYEADLFKMILEASKDGILENKEFEKWCGKHYSKILNWFDKILQEERKNLVDLGYIETSAKGASKQYIATQSLKDEALKIAGLKRYLLEYTLIKDRKPIEVALFEDYLIYAQMLGIADKVAKEFKELYPDLIAQTHYNSYDYVLYLNMYTRSGINRATSARAAAQSYSSGGGGFSSGGGGGGSFGGGGGGGGFR